ncbi:hypothetical protein ANN_13570 [Periplaneta americana]|uniref:Peptidase A1 domain-containing protein n=1 Tax=Periplaneta americana TaxID=6978 RepID=A0ABQ8TM68_PERAM|nr:hypothetical protein ANN_13570 [Periplaneta americana]
MVTTFNSEEEKFCKRLVFVVYRSADDKFDMRHIVLKSKVSCLMAPYLPDIRIVLGGITFLLNSDDYIIKQKGLFNIPTCVSAFIGMEGLPMSGLTWILGNAFLNKFYTEFDMGNQRIGFANAV